MHQFNCYNWPWTSGCVYNYDLSTVILILFINYIHLWIIFIQSCLLNVTLPYKVKLGTVFNTVQHLSNQNQQLTVIYLFHCEIISVTSCCQFYLGYLIHDLTCPIRHLSRGVQTEWTRKEGHLREVLMNIPAQDHRLIEISLMSIKKKEWVKPVL